MNMINAVARYNAKLLRRSWVFRFFASIVLLLITIYLLIFLSNIFTPGFSKYGSNRPESFFPYITVYLLNILQLFPVIFLAGSFYIKEQKVDTIDSIYIRPMNNLEYVIGVAGGIIKTFLYLGFIVLTIGALINIFGTNGSFNPLLYIFYYFTLAFPSLLFILGLSFLLLGVIRNRAIYIIVMLGIVFISIFFIGDIWQGVFDPFGITLPGVFSEITGHCDLTAFLLQRFCWLLIGAGMLAISVLLYKRLPNKPNSRKFQRLIATFLIFAGVLAGGIVISRQLTDFEQRKIYSATYQKYNDREKLTLLSQDIEYTQHGSKMEVISQLRVENRSGSSIREGILYLNPKLEILEIETDGDKVEFTKDNQVLLLQKEFAPNATVELTVHYKGEIDENIAYLDVINEEVYKNSSDAFNFIRYGKKYAFLTPDYTLLIPEVLWYPVTLPPVNTSISYDIKHNFAQYRLKVNNLGDKTAISQGRREDRNGGVFFEDEHPLSGISLIIGEYTTFSIVADSTEFELALLKKHDDIFKEYEFINDTIVGIVTAHKYNFEREIGLRYQFNRIRLVETPLTFTSYFRTGHGKSEEIQPEIALLPELGGKNAMLDIKAIKLLRSQMTQYESNMAPSEKEIEATFLSSMIRSFFFSEDETKGTVTGMMLNILFNRRGFKDYDQKRNHYELSPMFLQYVTSFHSVDYPILNIVVNQLIKELTEQQSFSGRFLDPHSTIEYLTNNSLKDAVYDKKLKPYFLNELFIQKIDDLSGRFLVHSIDNKALKEWIKEYIETHSFQCIDFDQFNNDFKVQFGVDWYTIIPEWFSIDKLPRFEFTDIKVEEVDEELSKNSFSNRYRIEFAVHNDSKVDGIISVTEGRGAQHNIMGMALMISAHISSSTGASSETFEKHIAIRAGEAKRVAFLVDVHPRALSISTNLSQNNPANFQIQFSNLKTIDTTQFEKSASLSEFLLPKGEIIIDNEDPGFSIVDKKEGKLRSLLRGNSDKSKYSNFYEVYRSKSKWIHIIDAGYYGGYIKSATSKLATNSSAYTEWSGEVEQQGEYEIFVYLPNSFMFQQFGITRSEGMTISMSSGSQGSNIFQYYTVISGGESEEEIPLNIDGQIGWTSLGKFQLESGQFQIRLLDKGEKGQLLYADAVKLLYLGE